MLIRLITFLIISTAVEAHVITPPPPHLPVKSYVLVDANSGQILIGKDENSKLPPASLTKIMSMYVLAESLNNNQAAVNELATVSPHAARMEGSRMFIKPQERISVDKLIKGMMVVSGNDATVALAEHLAGSEDYFTTIMNHYASDIGLTNTHYETATGLPSESQYSSALDQAKLALKLTTNHKKLNHYYAEKYFSHNGVKQTNRNRLIFKDKHISGLKTGHTSEAGYNLVAIWQDDHQHFITVVMGAPNELSRDSATQTLMKYGQRFFTTKKIYDAYTDIENLRVYGANEKFTPLQSHQNISITLPKGSKDKIKTLITRLKQPELPIDTTQAIADISIYKNDTFIAKYPLYSSKELHRGGWFRRSWDSIAYRWSKLFG